MKKHVMEFKSVCEIKECPDCASSEIVCLEEKDQIICRNCGLIFQPLVPATEELFEKTHGMKIKAPKKVKVKKKKKRK